MQICKTVMNLAHKLFRHGVLRAGRYKDGISPILPLRGASVQRGESPGGMVGLARWRTQILTQTLIENGRLKISGKFRKEYRPQT